MIRYKIIIKGEVQGVGFRYFAYHEAIIYGLTGWVRNCYDNSVEIEAQGAVQALDKYIISLSYGNRYAIVESLSKEEMAKVDNEKAFRITY